MINRIKKWSFWDYLLFSHTLISQSGMKLHFINVGQGSSCLVEFPCGVLLIDAGGESNSREFNSNEALTAYTEDFFAKHDKYKKHLKQFTLLILTLIIHGACLNY